MIYEGTMMSENCESGKKKIFYLFINYSVVTFKEHPLLNLVLAIPKCLQIHENKIIYQSNTTFLLCCYIHLGNMFRLNLSHLQGLFLKYRSLLSTFKSHNAF